MYIQPNIPHTLEHEWMIDQTNATKKTRIPHYIWFQYEHIWYSIFYVIWMCMVFASNEHGRRAKHRATEHTHKNTAILTETETFQFWIQCFKTRSVRMALFHAYNLCVSMYYYPIKVLLIRVVFSIRSNAEREKEIQPMRKGEKEIHRRWERERERVEVQIGFLCSFEDRIWYLRLLALFYMMPIANKTIKRKPKWIAAVNREWRQEKERERDRERPKRPAYIFGLIITVRGKRTYIHIGIWIYLRHMPSYWATI